MALFYFFMSCDLMVLPIYWIVEFLLFLIEAGYFEAGFCDVLSRPWGLKKNVEKKFKDLN